MKTPARFVISASKPEELPAPTLPEVAIVGRSNVGKSSLINALVGQDGLARTSRTPGRTRLINFFEVDSKPKFHLVDLPGYGYAEVHQAMRESWRPLIESYLDKRSTLVGVVLLIDIRRGVGDEELDFVPWLLEHERPVIAVLTKSDKLPKNKRTLAAMEAKKTLGLKRDPLTVSTTLPENLDPLWRGILKLVVPPPPPA
jgi:GTP-binding protein